MKRLVIAVALAAFADFAQASAVSAQPLVDPVQWFRDTRMTLPGSATPVPLPRDLAGPTATHASDMLGTGLLIMGPMALVGAFGGAMLHGMVSGCAPSSGYCGLGGALLGWGAGPVLLGAPILHSANGKRGSLAADIAIGLISVALTAGSGKGYLAAPLIGTLAVIVTEVETMR
ncbi:MAG: hypothetical protein OEZ65_02400 [Gemmatimonadota bacterium]|nr:hypothetical protein [Gemmatimonadota bacterium]MDH5758412.1 hypothetical protein [Gemmatimonadota bacterium]